MLDHKIRAQLYFFLDVLASVAAIVLAIRGDWWQAGYIWMLSEFYGVQHRLCRIMQALDNEVDEHSGA